MATPYYLKRPELEDEVESLARLGGEDEVEEAPEPPAQADPGRAEALRTLRELQEEYRKTSAPPSGLDDGALAKAQASDRKRSALDRTSDALYAAGTRQPTRFLDRGDAEAPELLQRRQAYAQEEGQKRQNLAGLSGLARAEATLLAKPQATGDDDHKRALAERLRALTEREKATAQAKAEQGEQDDVELEADRAALGRLFPGHDLSKMSRKGIEALMKQLNLSEAQKARLREKAAAAGAAKSKAEEKAGTKKVAEDFKMTDAMRKEFNSLPQVKAFHDVTAAFDKIQSAAKNTSAAGDLSLIFAFMKMLDPGSTVREGEFANAQNAGGVDDRILSQYNRVRSGERLTTDQRSDFLRQARNAYGAHVKQYEEEAKRYQGIAQRRGLSPEDVAATREQAPQAPAGDINLEEEPQTMEVRGKKYVRRNGKWFAQE